MHGKRSIGRCWGQNRGGGGGTYGGGCNWGGGVGSVGYTPLNPGASDIDSYPNPGGNRGRRCGTSGGQELRNTGGIG